MSLVRTIIFVVATASSACAFVFADTGGRGAGVPVASRFDASIPDGRDVRLEFSTEVLWLAGYGETLDDGVRVTSYHLRPFSISLEHSVVPSRSPMWGVLHVGWHHRLTPWLWSAVRLGGSYVGEEIRWKEWDVGGIDYLHRQSYRSLGLLPSCALTVMPVSWLRWSLVASAQALWARRGTPCKRTSGEPWVCAASNDDDLSPGSDRLLAPRLHGTLGTALFVGGAARLYLAWEQRFVAGESGPMVAVGLEWDVGWSSKAR